MHFNIVQLKTSNTHKKISTHIHTVSITHDLTYAPASLRQCRSQLHSGAIV